MNSEISFTRALELFETPVVSKSISIMPVLGSVADCYMAVLIRRTASSTSCTETWDASLILAIDSEIRTMDSS